MRKITIIALLLLIFDNLTFSQLVSFEFNNEPYLQASILNDSLFVSDFSLSNGSIGTNEITGDYFLDEPYIEENGGWGETNVSAAKYFYLDVEAISGFQYQIDSITMEVYVTGSGPSGLTLITEDSVLTHMDLAASQLYAISYAFEDTVVMKSSRIKIVGWDNGSRTTSGNGSFRLDNFNVFGKIHEVEIEATKLWAEFSQDQLFSDECYALNIRTLDDNNNVDTTQNGSVQIIIDKQNTEFESSEALSGNFTNGIFLNSDLSFSGSDTVNFTILSEGFDTLFISKYVGDKFFYEAFETDLLQWKDTSDWTIELSELKHNLTATAGTSFISSEFYQLAMKEGKMVWNLVIRNGDFDPTSSNRFWYYIMASDSNFLDENLFGYAVGVNFTGSTDTLCLWKFQTDGTKNVVAQSSFDWNENQEIWVEVILDNNSLWQLGYKTEIENSFVYTNKTFDNSFVNLPYHGLEFQYTSSRAGELWMDGVSVYQLNMPPAIEQLAIENDTLISICFTEKIHAANVSELSNYQILSTSDFDIQLARAEINEADQSKIFLTVSGLRTAEYQLHISNLMDFESSVMLPETLSFSYQVPAGNGDLVINEILFDYSPVVGLPEADFIEIFNTAVEPFYLNDWQIVIGESIKTFPDSTIYPGEHIIVTASSALADYVQFGKSIGILSNTALTNTGKSVKLVSAEGVIVDSIFYSPDWIRDPEKQDGGWSIERIDPENTCGAAQNWTVSLNEMGGTPGTQNSVYAANPDEEQPLVLSCEFAAQNQLQIEFSEEMEINTVLSFNNWIFTSNLVIDSIVCLNNLKVNLYLNQNFENNENYQLQISGLRDFCANQIQDTILNLLFHKAAAFDLVFNELMVDWEPSQGLPESDYIELYNRSSYKLQLEQWELHYGTTCKIFPEIELLPGEFLIISQSGFYDDYELLGKTVELLSSSSLPVSDKSLFLLDTTGAVIDSICYKKTWYHNPEKEDGGWSLERIDPENHCSTISNWTATLNQEGGTPGQINSVYQANLDEIKPYVVHHQTHSDNQLKLFFSEEIPANSILMPSNYGFLNSENEIDTIIFTEENEKEVTIKFENSFTTESYYDFSVKNISDYCGNQMSDTLLHFLYYRAQPEDIIFTELMADPSPSVALPESRYLELYNRSAYPINLNDWSIHYDTYYKEFPNFEMQPSEYLILCSGDDSAVFAAYGNVLNILSTTSLNTNGKELQLLDTAYVQISSLNYSNSWYQNPDKEDGGWSLERIDLDNVCSASQNWKASENSIGGTPGTQNSVLGNTIDNIKPRVLSVKTKGADLLEITFSEAMDTAGLFNLANYYCTNVVIDSMVSADNWNEKLIIFLSTDLQTGVTNTLHIQNISDLCGNIIADTSIQFYYHNINANDVVISELMVDPSPVQGLPEVEYIELYNRSSKNLNLENWLLHINDNEKILPDVLLNSGEYLLICHENAVVEFEENAICLGVSGFPTLPNQSGTISLLDSTMQTVNTVSYSDAWYQDNDKQSGGWALEIIDPDNVCSKYGNWTASINYLGGTPGQINSVDDENLDDEKPTVNFWMPITQNQLFIDFSEAVNFDIIIPENFSINEANPLIDLTIDSTLINRLWFTFADTFSTLTENILGLTEVEDFCENMMMDTAISFIYYDAGLYDVVFNEIFMNPSPSAGLPEVEFVELKNTTDKSIYIYDWKIQVNNSERQLDYASIAPQAYLLLGAEVAFESMSDFGDFKAINAFPALPQSATLQLFSNNYHLICQTSYESDWITDAFKADGGYSLERIDLNNPDESYLNWAVSVDDLGGTPGKINSVYKENPDLKAPNLLRAYTHGEKAISLDFSELMNFKNVTVQQFSLSDESRQFENLQINQEDLSKLTLFLDTNLNAGQIFEITVNDQLQDIAGNFLERNQVQFALCDFANERQLIINELLYNPYDGGTDFIELYNNSDKAFDLKQFYIACRDDNFQISSLKNITETGAVILPHAYMVLSENWEKVMTYYHCQDEFSFYEVASLPAFANSQGNVIILDTTGVVIDEFSYNEEMQFALLESTKGVSLERINPDLQTQDQNNWHSASEMAGWATPGYKNSVHLDLVSFSDAVHIDPEVFSPDNDGYHDFTQINYSLNEAGCVANVFIYDHVGRQVRHLVNNELLGTEGFWNWDGLADNQQKAPAGIYIVFIEIFSLDGKTRQYKKVCTINAQF